MSKKYDDLVETLDGFQVRHGMKTGEFLDLVGLGRIKIGDHPDFPVWLEKSHHLRALQEAEQARIDATTKKVAFKNIRRNQKAIKQMMEECIEIETILAGQNPDARLLFDCEGRNLLVVCIGDDITSKYGDHHIVKAFEDEYISLHGSNDRIPYNRIICVNKHNDDEEE
jgi:hypothetical protein